jgi:AcrR family transcriptional regulator
VGPDPITVGSVPAATTPQGAATRARIVAAAAELIARRGVAGTTLDDVRAATGTSKSQLYHYFSDKAGLVRAVIADQRERVLAEQRLVEEPIDSLEALQRWRYRTVAIHRRHGFTRPCPLGRLAAELGDDAGPARAEVAAAFSAWHGLLAAGLSRMVADGALRPEAHPASLATGLLAAVQGGLLLACGTRESRPLQTALDQAVAHVLELATDPPPG